MAANKATKSLPGAVGIGSGGGIIKLDDVTNTQGRTVPDATPKNSGVMTKVQAAQLAALVAGGGGGAFAFNVRQVAGDTAAAFGDLIDGDPSGVSFTASLPRANSVVAGSSNVIAIKNSSSSPNTVTAFPHDTDTIDGGGSVALTAEQYLFLVSDGVSNWVVISQSSRSGTGLIETAVKIANYNAAIGDLVRCDPSAGIFTINLPAAAAGAGEILVKVQSDSNNGITVTPAGGDTIDGVAGISTALLAREYIALFSDGVSDWMVIT